MKNILEKLFAHETLTQGEAEQVLVSIAEGKSNDAQLASFMTVYLMRSITPDELRGFRDALLQLCSPVDLPDTQAIDLCGTGGDGKNTFNISTLASFVVAGAGGKVIKHGNYGVSSVSGSSNVLEHFGYRFTTDVKMLEHSLERSGVCFLHAPLFHPALKKVAPVRKQLGMKTFFNMLGPLVNPARPRYRVTGVFSPELARVYNYLAQEENENYLIVHALDGYDEVSLTGTVKIFSRSGERLSDAESFGMKKVQPVEILGGTTVEEAAAVFQDVLSNKGTVAQENVVIANAALALQCLGLHAEISDAVCAARESLHSGKALRSFSQLLSAN
ncbi:MAG TPA: anthranilate phosphoribosyltransferase [Bacteroidia bacterium]|nr:anthranilate phosphoribosyltransferase [Bacteroidia bacterium]